MPLECCICHGDIEVEHGWAEGHNAEPVFSGRCCSTCNYMVVLPTRIQKHFPASSKEQIVALVSRIKDIEHH